MSAFLKLVGVLILIGGVSLWITRPRLSKDTRSIEEIERFIRQTVSRNQPPGMSVMVVKDGDVVYEAAFGMANGQKQIPAAPDTIYHWWSMTKVPTAIAILQLHDAGLLHLDDPVSRYLPYFEVTYNGEAALPITIRQLLRHTSGLPDPMPAMIGWVHFEDRVFNQTELLKQHLPQYSELKFEPDSTSGYSNLGYLVLGAIIENVSQQRYEAYIQDQILAPLGMNDTSFLYDQGAKDSFAVGSHPMLSMYTPLLPFLLDLRTLVNDRIGGILWFNPVYTDVTPSSGLLGSAEDAARLAQALLDNEGLLTEDSLKLLRPQGDAVQDLPLGWAEFSSGERLWVQHRGGGPGFASIMRLYPEEGLGIVIMANSTNLLSEPVVSALANIDWKSIHSTGDLQ